jgi:hypothetical protein
LVPEDPDAYLRLGVLVVLLKQGSSGFAVAEVGLAAFSHPDCQLSLEWLDEMCAGAAVQVLETWMSCWEDLAAAHPGVGHMETVVAQHMEDIPRTLAAHENIAVYLADHVAVTELMLEKLIVECDNFPHWEVDSGSWLRSPFLWLGLSLL